MILLLAGTKEGREIGEELNNKGYEFLATTVSRYGTQLLRESKVANVLTQALKEEDLISLIEDQKISIVIDATHPYAKVVSEMAINVTKNLNLPYLRFQRPESRPEEVYQNIIKVPDYLEAAKVSQSFKKLFLTIGSKFLKIFVEEAEKTGQDFVARVLPDPKVLTECYDLGLTGKNLIAMQGPFSFDMNKLMFLESKAEAIVTKDSGTTGGTEQKLLAAKVLNLPVILIERPQVYYGTEVNSVNEVINAIEELKEK